MRARLAALAAAPLLAAACLTSAAAAVRAVDAAHSKATFEVTHVYVQRVDGRIPIRSGRVTFDGDSTVPSSLDAVLDPHGVSTDDADRDEDLQGPDWFDTAKFGTWTYVSTSIAASAAGFTVSGTLTVHGVAQPVTLNVTPGTNGATYHAVGHASRHAFGMAKTAFDGLIGDDITIVLDVRLQ